MSDTMSGVSIFRRPRRGDSAVLMKARLVGFVVVESDELKTS